MDLGRLEASGLSRMLLLFSRSVTSNSLRPHGLQHAQLPCPSPAPGTCSNSCPVSQWCHPTHLILCFPLLLLPSIFPSIRFFSNNLALCIRWPKYWSFSFSISPSNEYSRLISFRTDWLQFISLFVSVGLVVAMLPAFSHFTLSGQEPKWKEFAAGLPSPPTEASGLQGPCHIQKPWLQVLSPFHNFSGLFIQRIQIFIFSFTGYFNSASYLAISFYYLNSYHLFWTLGLYCVISSTGYYLIFKKRQKELVLLYYVVVVQ